MKKYRILSQILFFLIFTILFLKTTYDKNNLIAYPVKAFLDLDPFIFLSTLFSLHGALHLLPQALFWSLITITVTLFLGRIFCGWVCPFGTINQWVGNLGRTHRFAPTIRNPQSKIKNGYRLKYYLLIFLLTASIFTLQLSGFIDPFSLLIRSFSVSIYPAFQYVVNSVFDTLYAFDLKWLDHIIDMVNSGIQNSIISITQPYYSQSLFIGLIFLTVILLNLYQRRFFCRYLCPLGACLGIFSSLSPIRVEMGDTCNRCGRCVDDCQGGMNTERETNWRKSECLLCGNCIESCPEKATRMHLSWIPPKKLYSPDLKKRTVLISLSSGIIAVPLLRIGSTGKIFNPTLIRPPGALDEKEFLKRCVKCGECLKVCLTNGLQPTIFEAGLEGMWSPQLVSKIGYCAYNCTLCGQVCPTGAIKKLSAEEKVKIKIGLAFIDQGRCLPYAFGINCIVCQEHCPTPKKAIWFQEKVISNREGEGMKVKQPVVDPELCIGCGICEFKCPLKDTPAIRVTSAGETRSKMNQPLL